MAKANAYNPFATALMGASRNPALMNAAGNLFGGSSVPGWDEYVATGYRL
jgi:hypothetical protein